MNDLLRTLFASMIAMGVGTSGLACEINLGDKDKDEDSDDDDKKKKKKKKSDDDDDDDDKKKKKKKSAKNDDDDEEEIDVAALLADSSDTSGVLSKTDLKGIDTSKAPRLGKRSAQSKGLQDAEWLLLPGGTLQIPNPKGWHKQKENNIGLIGSPDKKSFILFTTYQTTDQLKEILNKIGEKLEINNVDWKKPHDVKLGQDSIPAVVRGGELTTAKGEKGSILFALIETGVTDKVLALALAEDDVTKAVKDQTLNIILATRKKR